MKYPSLLLFIIIFLLSCKDQLKEEKKANNSYYDRAFEYLGKGVSDSAYIYFSKAKDLFLLQKDSLGAGKCLVNMGIISTDKGDYFGGQEASLDAMSYLNQKRQDQYPFLLSNFNNLGIATQSMGELQEALKFYDLAITVSADSLNTRIAQNNKATIYNALKDYNAAIKIYTRILNGATKNKKEYARALNNLSLNKWLLQPSYNPVPDFLTALRIREEENDLLGQNSSYNHLAEYYSNQNADSALFYAHKNYRLATLLRSADDQANALQKLVSFSPERESKIYFERFRNLTDSLKTARGKAKNQFALIRYETEKHKADFLRAQAENAVKRNSILIRNFILGILTSILILSFLYYRKRRKILHQEKELEVKNTELKYVKKIHDRVANKVYHVMSEVENSPEVDRDNLLDKLELLYNISRDISYESEDVWQGGNFGEQLSEMLQSYSSELTEVLIVGNEKEIWTDINASSKTELFILMQELMTNMKKHSKAESVVIKFSRTDCINILYTDDGIGIKDSIKKNGLTNTENRIKIIGGTITFDNIHKRGLTIGLSFPFS